MRERIGSKQTAKSELKGEKGPHAAGVKDSIPAV